MSTVATPGSVRSEGSRVLAELESEAITICREVAAETRAPVLLFSGGKDSAVLMHLALKASAPVGFRFP